MRRWEERIYNPSIFVVRCGETSPRLLITVEQVLLFSSLTYANSKNISRSPPFRIPTAGTDGRACKSGTWGYDEAGSHLTWRVVVH